MDLEECVQVKASGVPQLLGEGNESSVNACSCIRSQMQHSYSCPSTVLVYKSWWVWTCPFNTLASCFCSFDEHMLLANEAATVFLQSLSHCELITDDGIRHLGSGPCAHDHLEAIELDNCPLITDASLEHLKSCHSLDRIELYDCQQITRAGIKRLRVSHVEGTVQWLVVQCVLTLNDRGRQNAKTWVYKKTSHQQEGYFLC